MKRRPLKSRSTDWAKWLASRLAQMKFTPNQISLLSVVMSLAALYCFYKASQNITYILFAAVFIQLRLLCNLMDGMVAIEHDKKSKSGDIYNDAPDRFADIFIIMGVGILASAQPLSIHLAWLAAIISVLTAYVRLLGTSTGTESYFLGPMAKPHRMALITVACFAYYTTETFHLDLPILSVTLFIIVIGGSLTIIRRLRCILQELESPDE